MNSILIDARIVGRDGIGRVTHNVCSLLEQRKDVAVKYLCNKSEPITCCKDSGRMYLDESLHYTLSEIEVFSEAYDFFDGNVDIIHCLDYRVPIKKIPGVKLVVSIQDIFRYTDPTLCYDDEIFCERYGKAVFDEMQAVTDELDRLHGDVFEAFCKKGLYYHTSHEEYYKKLLIWALYSADLILTASKYVKSQILEYFNVQREIATIYYGVNHIQHRIIRHRKKQQNSYFLYVGQYRKHKNVDLIIDAFRKVLFYNPSVKLFLVGCDFSENNKILVNNLIKKGIKNNVQLMGGINDEILFDLYKNSICLIHMSDYEGFGFTPLEALTEGCKIIASKHNQTVREIVGDWGEYSDNSVEDLVYKMKEQMTDYHKFKEGEKVIKKYNWNDYIDNIVLQYVKMIKL